MYVSFWQCYFIFLLEMVPQTLLISEEERVTIFKTIAKTKWTPRLHISSVDTRSTVHTC